MQEKREYGCQKDRPLRDYIIFTAGTFPAKTYQQSIVLTKLRRIKFEKMFSFMMTCSIITSNDILDCKEILILFVIK